MTFEQLAEQGRVMFCKCLLEQFDRVIRLEGDGIHMLLQLGPTGEAVLGGGHDLGVAQREMGSADFRFRSFGQSRMAFLDALDRFGIAGLVGFQEVFGLILELLKIRPRGQLSFHHELSFPLRLMSAWAGRKKVRKP